MAAKRKLGCMGFMLLGFISLLILITLTSIAFKFLVVDEYRLWSTEFEGDKNSTLLVDYFSIDEERIQLNDRLEKFSSSEERVNFIELSPREFGIIWGDSISYALGERFEVMYVYVSPSDSNWWVYTKVRSGTTQLPWIRIVFEKENVESAVLNVSSITVGDSILPLNFLLSRINSGYRNALLTIEDSGLTQRKLVNIELEHRKMIIKSQTRTD